MRVAIWITSKPEWPGNFKRIPLFNHFFSARLAEVAIFCLDISTSKTTDLPNYWVNWSCKLVFMPLKKCGIHAKKRLEVMFKSQNKMTCIEQERDLASLLKLRKLPVLVVKNDQFQVFAAFSYKKPRISMWVKSISRSEPLAYHGPLFKRKDPLRLGLFTVKSVMFVACWKLNLAPPPHRVPNEITYVFFTVLMVSSVICKNSTRKTTTTALCLTWLDNPRMKIYSSP